MKNTYKILFAFISVLSLSCSGDDVENRPLLEVINAPEMMTPENNKQFVLMESNGDKELEMFSWSAAKYSKTVVTSYTLMMDIKGGDFTAAKILGVTSNATQLAIIVKNLNQAAIDLGAVPGEPKLFDLKIFSTVSGGVPLISETSVSISINTYSGLLTYGFTDWYLVGTAVQGGYDNTSTTIHQPLFRSGTIANDYKFTGYFNAGEFKFISLLGSWLPQLGMGADKSTIEIKTLDSQSDPGVFIVATAGYYTFTMNTVTLAASLVSYNASVATIQARIGYLGSSRTGSEEGWNGDDTEMTKSTFNPHLWSLNTDLFDGAGKFRANNAWDQSWGGDKAFSGYPANGSSSGDIPVSKSKYKIYFNDLDGSYLMIPNQE